NTTRRGSLAGQLKKDGLVSELWSSSNTFSFTAFIFVELKLTDKGAKNIKKIIEEFFAYMNMIKRIGYPRYVYEEQKIISDIGYKFKEHSEGLNVVKNLAKNMHYYPALDAEKCNDLIFEYDQASFNELLSSIDPEKMKVISKVAKGTLAEKDSCYGISYSVSKFSKATIKRFKEASNASFKYPERNIFVPQDFKPAMDDPTPYPHKIMDNEKGVIWYVQSKDELPLSYLNLLIITNAVNSDARSKLLSIIYTKLVLERLSDVADMAGDAGLSFGIERDDRGISLFFVGYSDKTIELAKSIVNELKAPFDDKQAFDDIRAGLADDYDGLLNGSSYDIAQYHRHNAVHTRHIHFSEYVGKLKNVTLSDVNNFIPKIYELISLEGYCYGSLSPKDIVGLSEYTHSFLNAGAMLRTDIPKDDIIACQLGEIHELHIRSKANDHCWASFFEFGERSTKLSAVIQLGYVLLEPFFFNQIRNKEQIAYVVETRLDFFEKVLGLSFTILSDRYKSEDIAAKAQLVMDKFLKQLNKITEEQFSNSKQALINKIRKTNHTLEEWMSEIVLTATLKGDAQYGEKLAAEISVLTIEEIKTVFSKAFNTKTRMSVSIYVDHV
ncbi:MAG: insulinase family protein, partial [bacterium]